jgi:hypothetical protein
MYETSKMKLDREKRKQSPVSHIKKIISTKKDAIGSEEGGDGEEDGEEEETGDGVSGDENDDDLGWEYQVGSSCILKRNSTRFGMRGFYFVKDTDL